VPVVLSDREFGDALATYERTAFRLELQPEYREVSERHTVRQFLAGQPEPPPTVPGLAAWYDQVAAQTAAGRRMERVRVHEDPPTDYQRWERWAGRWNVAAGERIRYMTRTRAHMVGLLPAAGAEDWWLLDGSRLIVMRFDADGQRIANELVTAPEAITQACEWWDLAVHNSEPDDYRGAATAA